jgi:nucleotide-binding universal stress UspA family protein
MAERAVIVAIDGSDAALQAARAGLAIVHPAADVVIVTVIEPSDGSLPVSGFAGAVMSPQDEDDENEARTAAANEHLAAAAAALGLHADQTLILHGVPGMAICDHAAERPARAIVIGSRGRGRIKRALLGSVSDYVVRNAPCPVVITGPT